MFLNNENQCTIYSQRPLVCRMYPVLWKNSQHHVHDIFIDLSCPYTHVKPLKEIANWSTELINKKGMKKMGPLVFDGRKGQYINYNYLRDNFDDLTLVYEKKK